MKRKNNTKIIKSFVLCIALIFGLMLGSSVQGKAEAVYTDVNVSNAESLKNELENGDLKRIKLTADIQQSPYYDFTINSSSDMVLDLNGHMLDFNSKGYLRVEGKLRVIDSSNAKNGQITNCSEDRQGIFVSSGGECILDSGKITGNIVTKNYSIGEDSRANGAGVYVKSGGTFTMNGGEISGNSHFSFGGGVCNNGTFNLHGGTIRNNSSGRDAGGVYNASSGQFYMDGGYITGNSSSQYGGGIYNCNECSFSGGEISNNTAKECGGAYFGISGSNTYMSGNPVIRNNVIGGSITNGVLSGGTSSNLYFNSGDCITVTGPLTGNSGSISVGLSCQTMFYDYEIDHGDYFACGSDSYTLKSSDLKVFTPEESGLNVYFNSEKKIGTIMSEWTRLGEKVFNASNDPDHPTVITLDKDYVSAADSDQALRVEVNKYVTLDLNGHKLSCSSNNSRPLIEVSGNLTIKDSKTGGSIDGSGRSGITADSCVNVAEGGVLTMKSGSICGNPSTNCNGGGVNIMSQGSFLMEGGTINGNSAVNGGGVYVDTNGSFTMTGGNIEGNDAGYGGGVYVCTGGSFTLSNGSIESNTAGDGGGVNNQGSFVMSNGTISLNSGDNIAGAVYNNGTFSLSGGTMQGNRTGGFGGGVYNKYTFSMQAGTITGNTAYVNGGGIFNDYYSNSFSFSGSPVIKDNVVGGTISQGVLSGGTKNNVYLNLYGDRGFLSVNGALTGGANIGISAPASESSLLVVKAADTYNSGTLTANDISKFFSDNNYRMIDTENGKAYLRSGYVVTFDSNGGSAVGRQVIERDGKVTKPADPVLAQHVFIGWYVGDTNTLYDFSSTVGSDFELKARWADCSVRMPDQIYGDANAPVTTKPDGSGNVSYVYYTDENCSTQTDASCGAESDGGVPRKVGTYYVKALIAASENYGAGTATDSFTISPKTVSANSVAGVSRSYEPDNLFVGLTGGAITGIVDGDELSLDFTAATGIMADTNAGVDKPVTVSGVKLKGADSDNYVLSQQPTGVTVTISKADNPSIVTPTASLTAEGKSIDLFNNVNLNGANGDVTYTISENSIGCSLEGSILTSGMDLGDVTVSVKVGEDGNYLASEAHVITVTVVEKLTYSVTVENGSGGGSFKEGATVTVSSNDAPKSREFDKWTSNDGVTFADAQSMTTTFVMPEKPVTVTATYRDCTHKHLSSTAEIPPTCLEGGSIAYWTCDNCGRYFSDENGMNEISKDSWLRGAAGHSYGTPTFLWSEDGHSCTATVSCVREGCDPDSEGHTVTETAVYEEGKDSSMIQAVVKKDSTINAMGVSTYTASFNNPLFAQQSKDVTDIPKKQKRDTIVDTSQKAEVVITSDSSKKPTVEYKASGDAKSKTVSVPATVTVNGVKYAVTSVADSAFAGCKNATTIVIGSNVTKISNNAFKGIKKGKATIKIKSTKLTAKSLGKKAFKGVGKNVVIKVPKKKLKAYTKLFRKKGLSKKVKIKKL